MDKRTIESAIAYYDTHDSRNEGWAWRVRYDDGHEESGALEVDDADDGVEIMHALVALVAAHGGPDVATGDLEYHDAGSGSYRWRA